MIALKTSPIWTAISRFGHPWPPFDFGSGMGVRDIGRREAIALGVIESDAPPPKIDPATRPGFNDNLRAHVPFSAISPEWTFLKETFGDQIQKNGNFVDWRGSFIRENFQKGGAFTMRLGCASPGLRAKLADRPETAALGKELKQQRGLEVTQDWLDRKRRDGTDHRAHFFPIADYPEDRPLTIGDIELMPSIWRKPDRVFNAGSGSICLEIDSLQGDSYRMIVSLYKKNGETGELMPRPAPKLSTFYRASEPFKEKQ